MNGKSTKPRIAVVSPFVDKRHGTERCIAEQLERLASDYEIHLFSSRVEDLDLSRIVWHQVPQVPGPHLVKFLWWFVANHIWRWRERSRSERSFDLVYSPGINCLDGDVLYVHVVFAEVLGRVRRSLRLGRNPLRLWPRLIHRQLFYRVIVRLERRIYGRGNALLAAVSQKTGEELERLYAAGSRTAVVRSGIDPRQFNPERRSALRGTARRELGLCPEEIALLLVGNDWRTKGLEYLFEAAAKLRRTDVRLLVCGEDDPAPYEHHWKGEGGLAVSLLPIRRDVETYYAAADVLVAPSVEDSFGLPLLEAMACELPVIASRKAGASEIVTHDFDGLVLQNPADTDELAGLIRRLLDDEGLRARLGKNAAKTAQQFTWEANIARVKQIFERTLAPKRRASAAARGARGAGVAG